ncbi:MAG: hypothetical protein Ct9H300mP28_08490 [Pseudomonadota bacterium]|nr:MAG: hypothetical protein Ct9H300mP28_08490 [Pseudomonadota bacterium]
MNYRKINKHLLLIISPVFKKRKTGLNSDRSYEIRYMIENCRFCYKMADRFFEICNVFLIILIKN